MAIENGFKFPQGSEKEKIASLAKQRLNRRERMEEEEARRREERIREIMITENVSEEEAEELYMLEIQREFNENRPAA